MDGSWVKSYPKLRSHLEVAPLFSVINDNLAQVEKSITTQVNAFDPQVQEYIAHILDSKGKRLRPALSILSAYASGDCKPEHVKLGTIVELIHIASLVHDDIMDEAKTRRGIITAFSKWGPEVSVLLGDMLFAHALKLCSNLPGRTPSQLIADAANEVCTGEILQTKNRFNFNLGMDDYMKFIRMKTAALFRAPTQVAAIINEVDAEKEEALRVFGESLGIAYQIYDDCLDLFGDEANSGKTLGTDLIVGKFTLPVIHYLSQLSSSEKQQLSSQQDKFKNDENFRREFMQRVAEKDSHQVALKVCQDHLETAKRQLKVLKPNTYTQSLSSLCDIVLEQLTSIR